MGSLVAVFPPSGIDYPAGAHSCDHARLMLSKTIERMGTIN